jgi:hypothetical protein
MKSVIGAGAACAAMALAETTYMVDVDMAGWVADAGYGSDLNSSVTVTLPAVEGFAGVFSVTAIEFVDLEFFTDSGAWLNELVLSVNDGPAGAFWDYQPSATEDGGTFGPASGFFDETIGGPFDVETGSLFVTAYTTWTPGVLNIASGTLRISYVPAPGALALLGLAGLAGSRRRRA